VEKREGGDRKRVIGKRTEGELDKGGKGGAADPKEVRRTATFPFSSLMVIREFARPDSSDHLVETAPTEWDRRALTPE